jgi:hypothetical protein
MPDRDHADLMDEAPLPLTREQLDGLRPGLVGRLRESGHAAPELGVEALLDRAAAEIAREHARRIN